MKTLSLSEAKMKLSALVEEVHGTDQEVVITRNGVPVAVLVSPDEFESWRETAAIRLDEESLSEAKVRAARSIKSRCRAVTSEDFERHAIDVGVVRRARALPLYHPRFPGVEVPGVVTVIVVPDVDSPMPVPT